MHDPVAIALHGIPASEALERYIEAEARKLERSCDRIRRCQVVAEALRREKKPGARFAVRLLITLPGTEVMVSREHDNDVYMALRDAFAAADVQLQDHMRRHGAERRSAGGASKPRS